MYQGDLQLRSSTLTKVIRDNPPTTVEPLGVDSLAESGIKQLPRPRQRTGMSAATPPGPSQVPTVLQLGSTERPLLSDLVLTILQHGYTVDMIVDDITVRIHPK